MKTRLMSDEGQLELPQRCPKEIGQLKTSALL